MPKVGRLPRFSVPVGRDQGLRPKPTRVSSFRNLEDPKVVSSYVEHRTHVRDQTIRNHSDYWIKYCLSPARPDDSTNILKDGQLFLSTRKNMEIIQETLYNQKRNYCFTGSILVQ